MKISWDVWKFEKNELKSLEWLNKKKFFRRKRIVIHFCWFKVDQESPQPFQLWSMNN